MANTSEIQKSELLKVLREAYEDDVAYKQGVRDRMKAGGVMTDEQMDAYNAHKVEKYGDSPADHCFHIWKDYDEWYEWKFESEVEKICSECSEPTRRYCRTKKGETCCDDCWEEEEVPTRKTFSSVPIESICSECSDCGKSEEELDANDVELTGEGKYARCLDCEDERFSHMEDACDECGDRVGRHAANVGTIGMPICFDCDSSGAMAEENEK